MTENFSNESSAIAGQAPVARAIDPLTSATSNGAYLVSAALGGLALQACGGGGATTSAAAPASPLPVTNVIQADAASRFLAQASVGASREQMAQVQALGYAGWIDKQMAQQPTMSRFEWLLANGYGVSTNQNSDAGFDASTWQKLLSSPDTLRQRVVFALSEITVVGISGLAGSWRAFSAAAFLDILEANAFGNYRTLLQAISTSAPMAEFLTFRGNTKFNAATGAQPDENYAREIMQLFTIGLVQLNLDGTPRLVNGASQETYALDDISGLARVFTGWDYDLVASNTSTPEYKRRPLAQVVSRHEPGAKSFLGTTIAAGTDGATSLKLALDALFAHPNVAPFVSRQLIQRLVCSNPSPAYVARVATVFNNDGNGEKGNLQRVIKAILLDEEARRLPTASATSFGKLREPILRFAAWARAFAATSASGAWAIGDTSDPATRLGQSPSRSSSVFNFFRPGYVPPNTAIGNSGMVAPEFQITNESTVVGYINFMQRAVSTGYGDVKADYSSLLPLADNPTALVAELNTVLAAGQLSSATASALVTAIASMTSGTDAARLNRIYAALILVLAAPEFIVQK